MSGIYGLWNLDGGPADSALVRGLGETLTHRGPDGHGLWVDGAVALGCQLMRVAPESTDETQPLVHRSGVVAVFDGRLDNRGECLARLRGCSDASSSWSDLGLVAEGYWRFGESFCRGLVGDFALAIFDPRRQALLLVRDSLGVRPLYYHRSQRLFLFASEIKTLLAHPLVPRTPDEGQLADFVLRAPRPVRLGYTFFRDVCALPPAHLARVAPDRFEQEQYWDFTEVASSARGSVEGLAEQFRHHFEQAIRRRTRSTRPVACAVSGGLDSSSCFCMAEKIRREDPGAPGLVGLSHVFEEGSDADEQAFLEAIERDWHVRIERLPSPPKGFLDMSTDSLPHVEAPVLDAQNELTRGLYDVARQRGARVLLSGHWGDNFLADSAYEVDLFERLAWGRISAHLAEARRWSPDADPAYFTWRRVLRDVARRHVPRSLVPVLRWARRGVPDQHATRQWYTDRFLRSARRWTQPAVATPQVRSAHAAALYGEARSSFRVFRMECHNKLAAAHGLEITFPFLDRDLVTFLINTPGEIINWRGVPKAILRQALAGVLPSAVRMRRGKADFTSWVNEVVAGDYGRAVDALGRSRLSVRRGYVRPDVVDRLGHARKRLSQPNALHAFAIGDVLGLEAWLGAIR